MAIPTVNTPRMMLRPFAAADAVPLHAILHQDRILQYFPTTSAPTLARVEALIERQLAHWGKHGFGWWAVQLHGQGELVGWNGLQYLAETSEVEIGYLLSKDVWGRGLATEGGCVGIRYGFETVGLPTIIGLVHPDNERSSRVLEKLGMHCTGPATYFGMGVIRYEVKASEWRLRMEELRA